MCLRWAAIVVAGFLVVLLFTLQAQIWWWQSETYAKFIECEAELGASVFCSVDFHPDFRALLPFTWNEWSWTSERENALLPNWYADLVRSDPAFRERHEAWNNKRQYQGVPAGGRIHQ